MKSISPIADYQKNLYSPPERNNENYRQYSDYYTQWNNKADSDEDFFDKLFNTNLKPTSSFPIGFFRYNDSIFFVDIYDCKKIDNKVYYLIRKGIKDRKQNVYEPPFNKRTLDLYDDGWNLIS